MEEPFEIESYTSLVGNAVYKRRERSGIRILTLERYVYPTLESVIEQIIKGIEDFDGEILPEVVNWEEFHKKVKEIRTALQTGDKTIKKLLEHYFGKEPYKNEVISVNSGILSLDDYQNVKRSLQELNDDDKIFRCQEIIDESSWNLQIQLNEKGLLPRRGDVNFLMDFDSTDSRLFRIYGEYHYLEIKEHMHLLYKALSSRIKIERVPNKTRLELEWAAVNTLINLIKGEQEERVIQNVDLLRSIERLPSSVIRYN